MRDHRINIFAPLVTTPPEPVTPPRRRYLSAAAQTDEDIYRECCLRGGDVDDIPSTMTTARAAEIRAEVAAALRASTPTPRPSTLYGVRL